MRTLASRYHEMKSRGNVMLSRTRDVASTTIIKYKYKYKYPQFKYKCKYKYSALKYKYKYKY